MATTLSLQTLTLTGHTAALKHHTEQLEQLEQIDLTLDRVIERLQG
jgi:hypothetical protein